MSWNFLRPLLNTKSTLKAYVSAVIPNSLDTLEKQGSTALCGALDSHIDEFEIWSLNHLLSLNIIIFNVHIHLANATAKMLEIAARQLIYLKENKDPINPKILQEEGSFICLSPNDRFRAITLLEQNKVDITKLPIPFRNNPGLVLAIMGEIAMFALLSYYNEWSGYGLTRTQTPEKRKLEHYPLSWDQVGYPGPSNGYHDFRGYPV